ncbi:hypothetical protein P2P32_24195 [Escherichia coli]
MTTITRENAEIKSFITGFLSDPAHDNQSSDSLLANVFRIALASLEAEPVAWKVTFTQIDHEYNTFTAMYSDKAEAERWVRLHKVGDFRAEITPLYAAPPAMVVPDEMDLLTCHLDGVTETYADGWNACRAAMLKGSQPVSQTYKLPVNTPCQDAPAHIWLQTAGVWPEDGELSELTWRSHNQHHDDTLYVRADLVNGNYPVTPDGWISCSERTSGKQVIELTMLVKQLVSQLKKAKPDCKLPDRAMDYLLRNGLISVEGVLR